MSHAHSSRLSLQDREQIARLRASGEGVRSIARALGRAPSTISREFGRNALPRGGYRAVNAQDRAKQRAARPKPSKLASNDQLRQYVQKQLNRGRSPEQISQQLLIDFPNDPEMRVSHEAIYRSLQRGGRGEVHRRRRQLVGAR